MLVAERAARNLPAPGHPICTIGAAAPTERRDEHATERASSAMLAYVLHR
jgi:hypothetical protein